MTQSSGHARKKWGFLCLAIVFGILFATLWPFNLFPRNRVRWLSQTPGISFADSASIAIANDPLRFDTLDGPCSVELLLRPRDVHADGPILSVYDANRGKQFAVRQWTDGLLVNHNIDSPGGLRRQKFDVDHAFASETLILVTISSGENGTTVYLNGKHASAFPHFFMTRQDLSGQLTLGNSASDYEQWRGQVRGLAVYSRWISPTEAASDYQDWLNSSQSPSLDRAVARYDFSERTGPIARNQVAGGPDLTIPGIFRIPAKRALKFPQEEYRENGGYRKDFVVNVIGFMPFGFLFYGYCMVTRNSRSAIFYAVLAGALFSFSIEVLQIFIPRRGSGWSDVISNTLGSLLGALLALAWCKWRNAPKERSPQRESLPA